MPWLFKKKTKFVLKARNRETGKWENIEEYDYKVNYSEVKDFLESLHEDGYDCFRLEETTEKGRRVKLHWTKCIKPKQKKEQSPFEILKQYKEMKKTLKELVQEEFGEKPSIYEIIADWLAEEELKKKVLAKLREYGLVGESGKKGGLLGDIGEILEILTLLRSLQQRGIIPQQPQQQLPQQELPQNNSNIQVNPQRNEKIVKQLKEELMREVEKFYEGVSPCEKGECVSETVEKAYEEAGNIAVEVEKKKKKIVEEVKGQNG